MADDQAEIAHAARKYWSAEGYTEGGVIREVDYATQSGGLDPMFAGIKIVDTDTHITEAPDLFTSRAPAALKDKVPSSAMPTGSSAGTSGTATSARWAATSSAPTTTSCLAGWPFPSSSKPIPAAIL